MNLQTRERDRTAVSGHDQESLFSENLVKSAVIGAIIGGLAFLVFRLWRPRNHTVPPIIIKSVDDSSEPIEIETERTLMETPALAGRPGVGADDLNLYQMSGFEKTEYVEVWWRKGSGSWHLQPYKNSAGSVVRLWLQNKDNGSWQDEPNGPHLVVNGVAEGWNLKADKLSNDKPNHGNNYRPRKRSFNKNKKWRIGKVQVDNHVQLSMTGFDQVVIEFDDHFH
jgi:hypothetical protein